MAARVRRQPEHYSDATQQTSGFRKGGEAEQRAHAAAALVASRDSATACCCSASLLSQRPAHSAHRPGPEGVPGTWQLWPGPETAAQTCQRAASGLPAAASLRAAPQTPSVATLSRSTWKTTLAAKVVRSS